MGRFDRFWQIVDSDGMLSAAAAARDALRSTFTSFRTAIVPRNPAARLLLTGSSHVYVLNEEAIKKLKGVASRILARVALSVLPTITYGLIWIDMLIGQTGEFVRALKHFLSKRRPQRLHIELGKSQCLITQGSPVDLLNSEHNVLDGPLEHFFSLRDRVWKANSEVTEQQETDLWDEVARFSWELSSFLISANADDQQRPESDQQLIVSRDPSSISAFSRVQTLGRTLNEMINSVGLDALRKLNSKSLSTGVNAKSEASASRTVIAVPVTQVSPGSSFRYCALGGAWPNPKDIQNMVKKWLYVLWEMVGHDKEVLHEFEVQLPRMAREHGIFFELNSSLVYAEDQPYWEPFGVVALDVRMNVNYEGLKHHYPEILDSVESLGHVTVLVRSKADPNRVACIYTADHKSSRIRLFLKQDQVVWASWDASQDSLTPFLDTNGGNVQHIGFDITCVDGSVAVLLQSTLRLPLGLSLQMPSVLIEQKLTYVPVNHPDLPIDDGTLAKAFSSLILTNRILHVERATVDKLLGFFLPMDAIINQLEAHYFSKTGISVCRFQDNSTGWLFWNDIELKLPALPEWIGDAIDATLDPKEVEYDFKMTKNALEAMRDDFVVVAQAHAC